MKLRIPHIPKDPCHLKPASAASGTLIPDATAPDKLIEIAKIPVMEPIL